MESDAVIFDFNGTMLFDTLFQFHAWNRVLEDCGRKSMTEGEYRDVLCGRSSKETVEYLWGSGISEEETQFYQDQKRAVYQELCLSDRKRFRLLDGLEEYLDELQRQQIPFTIATSSSPCSVDFYYIHLRLDRWFRREKIVCNDRIARGKPAPDLFLAAAKVLHTAPQNCLVFEDANAGIRAANRAGIGLVYVIDPENSFCPEKDLNYQEIYPDFWGVALPCGRSVR